MYFYRSFFGLSALVMVCVVTGMVEAQNRLSAFYQPMKREEQKYKPIDSGKCKNCLPPQKTPENTSPDKTAIRVNRDGRSCSNPNCFGPLQHNMNSVKPTTLLHARYHAYQEMKEQLTEDFVQQLIKVMSVLNLEIQKKREQEVDFLPEQREQTPGFPDYTYIENSLSDSTLS